MHCTANVSFVWKRLCLVVFLLSSKSHNQPVYIVTVNHKQCPAECKPQRIATVVTVGQWVDEISATRHGIFTIFSVFSIGMKLWLNMQISADHMTITIVTTISLATGYNSLQRNQNLGYNKTIFGDHLCNSCFLQPISFTFTLVAAFTMRLTERDLGLCHLVSLRVT